jgi:hypothetical protein
MKEVISVEKALDSGDDKRTERLSAAITLHKFKRTPGHHMAHFELRQRAKERAWQRALEEQQHRRVAVTVEEDPIVSEESIQPKKKKLRLSVVVVE